MTNFNKWIDTFMAEKGVDLEAPLTVEGRSGTNHMTYGHVVEAMKHQASPADQEAIRRTLVQIDFKAGNVQHFLRHAAQAIAL